MADYCSSKSTSDESVKYTIEFLINSSSVESSAFPTILETLNAVCAQFHQIYPIVIQFAQNILDKQLQAAQIERDVEMGEYHGCLPNFKPSLHLFSLLLAPKSARGDGSITLQQAIEDYAIKTPSTHRYDIAVMGFRYGHWKEVSLPLLESLDRKMLQSTFSLWIDTLITLTKCQPSELQLKCYAESTSFISRVQISLENLISTFDKGRHFKFAHSYIEIFTGILKLLRKFLNVITANSLMLANESEFPKRAIAIQCKLLNTESESVQKKFEALFKEIFDVDKESRAQLDLLKQFFDLISFCLAFFRFTPPIP